MEINSRDIIKLDYESFHNSYLILNTPRFE